MTLKERLLNAVIQGELGKKDAQGITITVHDFKSRFKDMDTGYLTSFLPASVIENGQHHITHTKFLFRVSKGIYRIHPDAIHEQIEKNIMSRTDYYPGDSFIREYAAAYG